MVGMIFGAISWYLCLSFIYGLSTGNACDIVVIVYKDEMMNMTDFQCRPDIKIAVAQFKSFLRNASHYITSGTCGLISALSCEDATLISTIAAMHDITHLHTASLSCAWRMNNTFHIPHLQHVTRDVIESLVRHEGLENALVIHDANYEHLLNDMLKTSRLPLLSVRSFVAVAPTLRHTQYTRLNDYRFIVIAHSGIAQILKTAREYHLLGIDARWLIVGIDASLNDVQEHIHDGDNIVLVNVSSHRLSVGSFSSCSHAVFKTNQEFTLNTRLAVECAVSVLCKSVYGNVTGSVLKNIKDNVENFVNFGVYKTDVLHLSQLHLATEWSYTWEHHNHTRLFQNFTGFKGRKFIVTTLNYDPFEIRSVSENGSVSYTGICLDMLNTLASALNFTYEIIEPADGKWGSEINGSWNGMIGLVARKEAFMAVGPFTISADRSKVVDFMTPFMAGPGAMLMRRPKANNKAMTYIRPFKSYVWIAIGIAIVFSSVVMFLFEVYSRKMFGVYIARGQYFDHFCQCIVFVYGSIMQQGGTLVADHSPSRLYTSFWWWFAIIIIATYTGNLIAFLTVSKADLPINTLDDLVFQSEYSYGTIHGTALHDLMMKSKDGVYKQIGDQWRKNPAMLTTSAQYVNRVKTEKYVFIGDKTGHELRVTKDCNLVILKEEFFSSYVAFAVTKSNPYLAVFNKKMQHILEAGLYQIWKRNHWPRRLHCVGLKAVSESKPASLADIQGAFYVIAIGLALAFACFVFELVKKPSINISHFYI